MGSKNQLNGKERFALWNFVQAEYTKSGLTDVEFAKVASDKLSILFHDTHIAAAREGLEIPNNLKAIREMSPAQLVARVQALEAAMQGLYRHLGWTPGKEG